MGIRVAVTSSNFFFQENVVIYAQSFNRYLCAETRSESSLLCLVKLFSFRDEGVTSCASKLPENVRQRSKSQAYDVVAQLWNHVKKSIKLREKTHCFHHSSLISGFCFKAEM